MYHYHFIEFKVAQLRYQEMIKQAEADRQAQLLPRPQRSQRWLYSLGGLLIALGQWLQSGSKSMVGALGLSILLLSACSAPTGWSSTSEGVPAPLVLSQTSSSTLSALTVEGWQTYEDPISGVLFEHPPAWAVNDLVLAVRNMSSRYTVTLADEAALDASVIVKLTVSKDAPATLAEAVAQQKAELAASDPSVVFHAEEAWTLTWRRPAVYLRLTGSQGPAGLLIAASGDKIVLLSGTGDLNLFQMIAHTLRIKHKYGPT